MLLVRNTHGFVGLRSGTFSVNVRVIGYFIKNVLLKRISSLYIYIFVVRILIARISSIVLSTVC